MSNNKKYWYIQLNVNFFEDDRIDWLCEQKNGYAYVVLYLKLCLKTANNNGILMRQIGNMIIPYDIDKIADMTHIDVDIVRVALDIFKRIGLIYEADENCNFMRIPAVPSMVGYTTQYAIDKAKQREKKRILQLENKDNVSDIVSDNVSQELRDKSIELRDNNSEKREKSKKKKKTVADTPTLSDLEERFSHDISVSVLEWLEYKEQRKEQYNPMGLKKMLTQLENNIDKYGESAVIGIIDESMANGWKGIIYDRLKGGENETNRRDHTEEAREFCGIRPL